MSLTKTLARLASQAPKVRWFFAPEPALAKSSVNFQRPAKFEAKKWSAFSIKDLARLEHKWKEYMANSIELSKQHHERNELLKKITDHRQTPLAEFYSTIKRQDVLPTLEVVVNDDRLMAADVERLTLSALYWDGPVYAIRRGLWFSSDGSPLNLALSEELEVGWHQRKDQETFSIQDNKRQVVYANEDTAYIVDDPQTLAELRVFIVSNVHTAMIIPGVTEVRRGYLENSLTKPEKPEKKRQKLENDAFSPFVIKDNTGEMIREEMSEENLTGKRKISHLVFCIHGIGQILGSQYQNVNFIHTVSKLRKNLKKDCKDYLPSKECNMEVIPIIWRNLIDFNNDSKIPGEEGFPSLKDVTIKELGPLRYLINNTLLDILLYYEAPYKNEILFTVINEINNSFRRFMAYNPDFNGKVSIIGHSLGSAIGFEILSSQRFNNQALDTKLIQSSSLLQAKDPEKCQLDFNVDNLFLLGSPLGLFNLLKRKLVKLRKLLHLMPEKDHKLVNFEKSSYPSCNNLYNVFDLSDPVAYRLEPLVAKRYADKKCKDISYKELLKSALGIIDSIIDSKIVNSGRMYLNEYTGPGLSLLNRQLESLIDASSSFFKNEEKEVKKFPVKDDVIVEVPKAHLLFNDRYHQLKNTGTAGFVDKIEMLGCNSSGRIDYTVPQGAYDIILINALKSHITYFENEHISKFLVNELLVKKVHEKSEELVRDKNKDIVGVQ